MLHGVQLKGRWRKGIRADHAVLQKRGSFVTPITHYIDKETLAALCGCPLIDFIDGDIKLKNKLMKYYQPITSYVDQTLYLAGVDLRDSMYIFYRICIFVSIFYIFNILYQST